MPKINQGIGHGDCTLVTAAGRCHQFSDSYFVTAGPTLWYSLPEQLPQPYITFGEFKRSLKTFMFGQLGRGALCLNVKGAD